MPDSRFEAWFVGFFDEKLDESKRTKYLREAYQAGYEACLKEWREALKPPDCPICGKTVENLKPHKHRVKTNFGDSIGVHGTVKRDDSP